MVYIITNNITFGMKTILLLHGIPSNLYEDSGHKNGVAKNTNECVGISTSICNNRAKLAFTGFLNINQSTQKTIARIKILWVILYIAYT